MILFEQGRALTVWLNLALQCVSRPEGPFYTAFISHCVLDFIAWREPILEQGLEGALPRSTEQPREVFLEAVSFSNTDMGKFVTALQSDEYMSQLYSPTFDWFGEYKMDSIPLHDAFLRSIWRLPGARIKAGKLMTQWNNGIEVTREDADAILTEYREIDADVSEWFNDFIASQRRDSVELMQYLPNALESEKFKMCAGEWVNWKSNGAEAFLKFRCNYLIIRYIRSKLYDAFHPIVNQAVHTLADHNLADTTLFDMVESLTKLIPSFWNYEPDEKVEKLFEDYSCPRERSRATMAVFPLTVLRSVSEITEEQRAWVDDRMMFILGLSHSYGGIVFSIPLPNWRMIPEI